jgi:hypothetical protein
MMRMRWKLAAVPCVGALCLAFLPAFGVGEEKVGKAPAEPKAATLTKMDKESLQAAEKITLACALADWGRGKAQSPAALIAAAQLLADANPRDITKKEKIDADQLEKAGFKAPPTPEELLKDAAKMSNSPEVAALVKDVEKSLSERPRGRNPGPFVGIFDMPPRGTFAMKIPFKGGETAIVGATVQQGAGEVRLTISDPVAGWSKSEQGQAVRVQWFQAEFGEVTMSRNNLTDVPIRCYVYTN